MPGYTAVDFADMGNFCKVLLDPSQQETIICNINFLQNFTNPSLQVFHLSLFPLYRTDNLTVVQNLSHIFQPLAVERNNLILE